MKIRQAQVFFILHNHINNKTSFLTWEQMEALLILARLDDASGYEELTNNMSFCIGIYVYAAFSLHRLLKGGGQMVDRGWSLH